MTETNFTLLTNEQKTTWSRDVWKTARNNSYIMNLAGSGMNAPIERITELTKSEKGTRAVITLVPDLEGDGVVGDTEIEGNEEEAKAYDKVILIDQMRNANKLKGRMADQKSVVNFRVTSRDLLGYWLGDRVDQLASLTLAGVDYRLKTNGGLRPGFTHDGTDWARNTTTAPLGQAFIDLEFATTDYSTVVDENDRGDLIAAPSAKRHFRWDAVSGLVSSPDTADVAVADTPSYAMLVEAKAYAKDRRLKAIRGGQGAEVFHVLMHPKALAKLKLDSDFLANVRSAGTRGSSNPLFSGAIVTVDGLVIHEFTHTFNTLGATAGTATNAGWPGYKWGADADVDGSRIVMIGAQGLAYADIGIPEWDERNHFDYGAKPGIAIAKICGFMKPQFYSPMDGTTEDFGVLAIDVAI